MVVRLERRDGQMGAVRKGGGAVNECCLFDSLVRCTTVLAPKKFLFHFAFPSISPRSPHDQQQDGQETAEGPAC